MLITKAKPSDLTAINILLTRYGIQNITPEYINHRDISLVAKDDSAIVGFIWCGLMSSNKLGYVDFYVVDEKYSKTRLGTAMAFKLDSILVKIHVKRVIGLVMQSMYHDKSINNAVIYNMQAHKTPYTFVFKEY